MLNYFALYGFQPSFHPGADELRQAYLRIQKEWHPDFFISDPDKYTQALEKTALNNQAYKAMRDLPSLLDYVLREFELLQEGEKNLLSPTFLAEMLDLNDLIGEAAMGDTAAKQKANEALGNLQQENLADIEKATRAIDGMQPWTTELLQPLKNLYQQFRYLGRLRKNLDGVMEI
jgi:molecular chaperone HscB